LDVGLYVYDAVLRAKSVAVAAEDSHLVFEGFGDAAEPLFIELPKLL
jgi:hypothetical protein